MTNLELTRIEDDNLSYPSMAGKDIEKLLKEIRRMRTKQDMIFRSLKRGEYLKASELVAEEIHSYNT